MNLPALRFTAPDGTPFPNWQTKKLEEYFIFIPTNSLSRDKLSNESGEVYNIHYGDIHTKYSTSFIYERESVPSIIPQYIPLNSLDKFVKGGDLIIADASEDYNDIGKAIEIISTGEKNILAGLHTIHAQSINRKIVKGFSSHWTKSWSYRKQVMRESQGAKVLGISSKKIAKLNIPLPSLTEQEKIATALTAVDDKITALKDKTAHYQAFKKGLMQQLFPQS